MLPQIYIKTSSRHFCNMGLRTNNFEARGEKFKTAQQRGMAKCDLCGNYHRGSSKVNFIHLNI